MSAYVLASGQIEELIPIWTGIAHPYIKIWGYNAFGDLFLEDPVSQRIAILFTINPELVQTNFNDVRTFQNEILSDPGYADELIQPEKTEALLERLGPLGDEEVYIPQPYQFLGGDGSVDSYSIGNIWVHLELIGQLQLKDTT